MSYSTQVEEGVCQLISYLWLKYKHLMEEASGARGGGHAFRGFLREYYLHQIEHESSPVYGDGFREALAAYNRTHSLQQIFDHIRLYRRFP